MTHDEGAEAGLQIAVGGQEFIDEVGAVWLSLFDHHRSIGAGGLIVIDRADSWPRRRAYYERLITKPSAFIVLARRGQRVVGYVFAHVHPGADDTWPTGEGGFGEIETLAVLATERGAGLGNILLDTAEQRFADSGVSAVMLHVMKGNDGAQRFYAKRGMTPVMTTYMRLGAR